MGGESEGSIPISSDQFRMELESMISMANETSISQFPSHPGPLMMPALLRQPDQRRPEAPFSTNAANSHRNTYDFLFNANANSNANPNPGPGGSGLLRSRQNEHSILPRRHSYAHSQNTSTSNFMHYKMFLAKKRDFV
jgi:hypothetical protein